MTGSDAAVQREVTVEDDVALPGILTDAPGWQGMVLFAHGSGSSRLSPRNQAVAAALHGHGLGTLLFDLLTRGESLDRSLVFDIDLLADRLASAAQWLAGEVGERPLGLFGASTGAAAALVASTRIPTTGAVVSRGGRPDLAGSALPEVVAPTLLIVGSRDHQVLALNEAAMAEMTCPVRLEVVPGASHLFEEPGTLEEVTRLAGTWLSAHLGGSA